MSENIELGLTFKQRVEQLASVVTTESDINGFLCEGAVELITVLPVMLFDEFLSSTEIPCETGLQLSNSYRIVFVTRDERQCRKISYSQLANYTNALSLYSATEISPVYFVFNNTLCVVPTTTSAMRMHYIGYPTIVSTDRSIPNFPPELEHGVVLYASLKWLTKTLQDKRTIMSGLTAPTFPEFSYTEISFPDPPDFTTIDSEGFNYTVLTVPDAVDISEQLSTLTHVMDSDEDFEYAQAKMNQIQLLVQNWTVANSEVINRMKADKELSLNYNLSKIAKTLENEISSYDAQLKRFSTMLGDLQAKFAIAIQKHGENVRTYTNEMQQQAAEHDILLKNLATLKEQYMNFLAPYMGTPK